MQVCGPFYPASASPRHLVVSAGRASYAGAMQDPILFVLTVLAILGTPGPTNTLLATSGAVCGLRRSLRLLPAEAAGYLLAILALALLLGPLVAGTPVAAAVLRCLVGGYLVFLAWRLWRVGGTATAADRRPVTPTQIFVTTLLNPKAILFAFGVIPFGGPHPWLHLAAFTALTAAVGCAWIVAGCAIGSAARTTRRRALVPRTGAAVLGALGLFLVVSPLMG